MKKQKYIYFKPMNFYLNRISTFIIVTFCFLMINITNNAGAQNWEWQNPLPTGDGIEIVQFINDTHGWAVTQGAMLLRTTDGGDTWDTLNARLFIDAVSFITPEHGWCVARKQYSNIDRGVYHTSDGGATWEQQVDDENAPFSITFINTLTGWTAINDTCGHVLLYTTDGGTTWEKKTYNDMLLPDGNPVPYIWVRDITFTDSLRGYVVGNREYGLRTTNGGQTWMVDSSMADMVQIIFSDSLHGWAVDDYFELIRTVDGGETWQEIELDHDIFYDLRVWDIFALDSSRVFVASEDLYYSSDGGITWEKYSDQELGTLWFLNETEAWGGAYRWSGHGFYHSTDKGRTWESQIKGFGGRTDFTEVDFVSSSTGWVAGYNWQTMSNVLFKTTDGGANWSQQLQLPVHEPGNPFIDNYISDLIFCDVNTGWMVYGQTEIYFTSDGGNNWEERPIDPEYSAQEIHFFNTLNGWAVGSHVLRTSDGGRTWVDKTPPAADSVRWSNCTNYERSSAFADTLCGWVVGDVGNHAHIFHTSDGGNTWQVQYSIYNDGRYLNNICCIDTNHVRAASYNFFISSDDGGTTWQEYHNELAGTTLYFLNENDGWISGRTIFKTTDGGKTWGKEPTWVSTRLFDIDFPDKNNGWVVGSEASILHTGSGDTPVILPVTEESYNNPVCILNPNYPNPFNPETSISFDITRSGAHVTVEVFDLLGRKIVTLFNENVRAGTHTVVWDGTGRNGSSLPSGVYLYRVTAENTVRTGKMLMVR